MPLRFNTIRSLLDAFPTARDDVKAEPQDIDPLVVLRALAEQGKLPEAMSLAAYLLPRREAVDWGCRSLRVLHGDPRGFDTQCLLAAEAWVRQSDEPRRSAAREVATRASDDDPATWVARAALWSGGSIGPNAPIPVPAHLTAVAVRIALLLALRRVKPEDRLARGRACIDAAIRIADAEP